SLAPEVLRAVIGVSPGWPRLHMLDSTDPSAVRDAATPPDRTLYLLASKSGTTIEPNSLAAHFRDRLQTAGIARWADHFVAITDSGTELDRRARVDHFRDLFINPSDIGGRYSALSFFGMVPAALMGQDVGEIIGWSLAMLAAADAEGSAALTNPAVALGLVMGAAAKNGRDKLTLVCPPSLDAFGLWIEQLIAESTGKDGKGIVPIAGEPLGDPADYGDDRTFLYLRHVDEPNAEHDAKIDALAKAGHPVIIRTIHGPTDLGRLFFFAEFAIAVAGWVLGINPFDQPNVQEAKDATKRVLTAYAESGRLPDVAEADDDALRALLSGKAPPHYVAVLGYLQESEAFDAAVADLR